MSDEDLAQDGTKDSNVDQDVDPDADALRVAARALGRAKRSGQREGSGKTAARGRKRTSGSSRDPQLVGSVVDDFLAEQGWQGSTAMARLVESWADVVGPEVAEHVVVESWTDGELVLKADSTAWATQIRLLSDTLLRQIRSALSPGASGEGLVRTVSVRGPQAPSWRSGPRVVKGRGPRDTYG